MTRIKKNCIKQSRCGQKGIKNIKGKQERLSIFTALLKLRQVCIHPQLKEVGASKIESANLNWLKKKLKN